MRRAAVLSAVAAALAVALVVAGLGSPEGSGAETHAPAASLRGDTAAHARAERTVRRRTQAQVAENADEEDDGWPNGPSCAGAPPPTRRLFVLDPDGKPVEDVEVYPGRKRTCEDGMVEFPVDAPDAAPVEASFFDGRELRRVTLDKPETQAVAEHFPLLDVAIVDASTGNAVQAETVGVYFRRSTGSYETPLRSGRTLRLPVTESGEARLCVRVVAPAPFATIRGFAWRGRVAPGARRVRFVVPVWPVTQRTVRVLDEAGMAVKGAGIYCLQARFDCAAESIGADSCIEFSAELSNADGTLVIGGLPALPACGVNLHVNRSRDDERGLPGLSGHVDNLRLDAARPTGASEVRLRRSGGCPLAAEVPPGGQEPSDPPPPPDGDDAQLAGSEPRVVFVRVADSDGRSVPGACVTPFRRGEPVAQLDGDVQLLTPRTGPDGSVRLAVPPGTAQYVVTLAGARADAESAEDVVRVTLRSP